MAHLRLAVASAAASGGDSPCGRLDRAWRVARALAECKLRARAELGPKLLAIGDVADAAEVARRGLASCAESRVDGADNRRRRSRRKDARDGVDKGEGKDVPHADEDAGAPRVGTRRDAATFLFLAGDCERALGEVAAAASSARGGPNGSAFRKHDRKRRAAMDAARRAAVAEAEDVAANAKQVAARAALYERTSHTHVEGEKARREKTAALATAMAHSGAAAEMADDRYDRARRNGGGGVEARTFAQRLRRRRRAARRARRRNSRRTSGFARAPRRRRRAFAAEAFYARRAGVGS